ncbi:MAG: zf-HC2 domain-containing protein [Acidobacteriaceae bacterium]|nr:zf-HC2 domain-containing protein [Acidobacteriaceae bacterium]
MFSLYLDGAITGRQMRDLGEHLNDCTACRADYSELRRTHTLVTALGTRKAPAELALKVRVALSREIASDRRSPLQNLAVHLENALNAFMLPATAGVVSAVICFGLLIGVLAFPASLVGSRDDVPTLLYTPPQLQALPPDLALVAPSPDPVVVETLVDANGRVQDYRIISGPGNHDTLRPELNNIMIFTTFRPATSFGVPTQGRAVISFAKINVKG